MGREWQNNAGNAIMIWTRRRHVHWCDWGVCSVSKTVRIIGATCSSVNCHPLFPFFALLFGIPELPPSRPTYTYMCIVVRTLLPRSWITYTLTYTFRISRHLHIHLNIHLLLPQLPYLHTQIESQQNRIRYSIHYFPHVIIHAITSKTSDSANVQMFKCSNSSIALLTNFTSLQCHTCIFTPNFQLFSTTPIIDSTNIASGTWTSSTVEP